MRPTFELRVPLLFTLLAITVVGAPHRVSADVTVGFVEDFSGTSTNGWTNNSLNPPTNPGSGGTLGVGDGFLRIERPTSAQLGAHVATLDYSGNWLAAGAKIRFALNDIESDEALSIHFAIGTPSNFWQCDLGFVPPEQAWGTFEVILDSTQFTQIIIPGVEGFAAAIQNVDRILVRHDLPPFIQTPNNIAGQVGLDHVEIIGTGVGVDPIGPIAGTGQPVWLAPPAPNPSRGAVVCAAETNDGGTLRFTIHDARGRLVRAASLESSGPGRRTWMWDGLDENGARVAAGVYRVRAVGAGGGTSRSLVRID